MIIDSSWKPRIPWVPVDEDVATVDIISVLFEDCIMLVANVAWGGFHWPFSTVSLGQ